MQGGDAAAAKQRNVTKPRPRICLCLSAMRALFSACGIAMVIKYCQDTTDYAGLTETDPIFWCHIRNVSEMLKSVLFSNDLPINFLSGH